MKQVMLVLAVASMSLPAGCVSNNGTADPAKEETAGSERSTGYRGLQGSSGYSSEEAADQIAGE